MDKNLGFLNWSNYCTRSCNEKRFSRLDA